jgi:hypothetical protein
MLPIGYESVAAIALVLGGAIACFAGYRLFRIVLAIYGFIVGAMLASSTMGSSNTLGMVLAALVGGVVGSVLMFFAYFVGIALLGAGLGAVIVHGAWSQASATDPPVALVILFAVLGTVTALILQRYVIIVGTAFSGAWTMVLGGIALAEVRSPARGRPAADVWILYPFTPGTQRARILAVWILVGLIGTAVQLGITSRKR